ncbi:MAG: CFI-box-CTERM domain-containing protein [Bacillota bacterium]|mgnify:CR=1 FL=1|jgi:hypothetical protein
MKYRSESLFTKYQIPPTKNVNELRVLFQTDPNKRKDLPVVIKTISNPAALLEEELFTPHESNGGILDTHKRLLENLPSVLSAVDENNTASTLAGINAFANSSESWEAFNYYKTVGKAKADQIIREFLSMVMDLMEQQFFSTIGEISWTKSKKFLTSINGTIPFLTWDENRKSNFEDKLIEYASKLSSLEGKSEGLEERLSIVLSIAETTKNRDMIDMLKFTIKKIGDDYDNNGKALLKSYKKIAALYGAQELLDMSGFINRMMNKYLDFHGTTNFNGSEILEFAKLLSDAYAILQKKLSSCSGTLTYDKNFDKDDIEFGKLLSDFMASTSASWINTYKTKLNAVKGNDSASNIYSLIEHIMSAKPSSSKLKNFLGNVVLKFTGFEGEIAWAFNAHEQVNKNPFAKHANPNDIDNIIAKYYWTIFMLNDVNENLFNNIRGIGFDVLAKVNSLTSTLNQFSSNYDRMRVRDALINALNTLPRDWYMDDKRVEKVIRDFGGTPTGSVSESSEYIDKYEYLFKGTKSSKHGRYKYEHPYSTFGSSSSSSSSSSYRSSSSSSSSSGGCYIATCVYGSYDCPEVWTLRRYRDYYLDEHWWGRLFIKTYYAISPTLVKLFGKTKWFKNVWKPFLERKVKKLKEKGYEDTAYNDKY